MLRAREGMVRGDTVVIYPQTGLVRQMLIDDERGVLPQGITWVSVALLAHWDDRSRKHERAILSRAGKP